MYPVFTPSIYHQIYPDENHGLSGVLPHLHSTMESFFTSCLGNVTLLSPSDTPYTLSDVDTWNMHFWSSRQLSFFYKHVSRILSCIKDKWTISSRKIDQRKSFHPIIDWPGSLDASSSTINTFVKYSFRSFIPYSHLSFNLSWLSNHITRKILVKTCWFISICPKTNHKTCYVCENKKTVIAILLNKKVWRGLTYPALIIANRKAELWIVQPELLFSNTMP